MSGIEKVGDRAIVRLMGPVAFIALLCFVSIILLSVLSVDSNAEPGEEFTVDGIKYEVIKEEGTCFEVSVIGFTTDRLETFNVESVEHDGIVYHITSIGESAFGNCTYLNSVKLPNTVTYIGRWAFYNCISLRSVDLGNSVETIGNYAFCRCKYLTSLNMSDSVTSIGNLAFEGCHSLTGMDIPASVDHIGFWAFKECASITEITIPKGVTSIDERTFYGCSSLESVIIQDGVRYIGNEAFYGCESLKVLEIPESVTSLGYSAFHGCAGLEKLSIPISINTIVDDNRPAFFGCTNVNEVTFTVGTGVGFDYGRFSYNTNVCENTPWNLSKASNLKIDINYGVTHIGDSTFAGCVLLDSIKLPDSIDSVGSFAFHECTGLRTLSVPITLNTSVSSFYTPFLGCVNIEEIILTPGNGIGFDYSGEMYTHNYVGVAPWNVSKVPDIKVRICEGVTYIGTFTFAGFSHGTIELPSSIEIIGDYAFNGSSIPIPLDNLDALVSIGDHSFCHNNSITSLSFPKNLESIGRMAFYDCASLKTVEIPDNVTSVEYSAFANCYMISRVYVSSNLVDLNVIVFNLKFIIDGRIIESDDLSEIVGKVWVGSGVRKADEFGFGTKLFPLDSGFEMKFDANGGTSTSDLMTTFNGHLISLPTASKDGSKFLGWWTDPVNGIQVDLDTEFSEGCTLYAHWSSTQAFTAPVVSNVADNSFSPAILIVVLLNLAVCGAILKLKR